MSYCYLVYREIGKVYLNDFVIKFGFSENNDQEFKRTKAYQTPFCNDSLVNQTWLTPFPREDETAILKILDDLGLLRKHTSGYRSELITLAVTSNMTVGQMVVMYEKLVVKVKEIVENYFHEKDYQGDEDFINDDTEESNYECSEEELE